MKKQKIIALLLLAQMILLSGCYNPKITEEKFSSDSSKIKHLEYGDLIITECGGCEYIILSNISTA